MRKRKSIKAPNLPSGRIPSPNPPHQGHLTVSFKHFNHRAPFVFPGESKPDYPKVLVERLRALCRMTPNEARTCGSPALRSHPIRWEETTEPAGWDHLNQSLREQLTGWQFSVSSNEYGRIHGSWIDDVFYVIWIDHGHALYQ